MRAPRRPRRLSLEVWQVAYGHSAHGVGVAPNHPELDEEEAMVVGD